MVGVSGTNSPGRHHISKVDVFGPGCRTIRKILGENRGKIGEKTGKIQGEDCDSDCDDLLQRVATPFATIAYEKWHVLKGSLSIDLYRFSA